MQQVVLFGSDVCFSQITEDGDNYYSDAYYKSLSTFRIQPNEDVILILKTCGSYWFRGAVAHDLEFENDRFVLTKKPPRQIAVLVRNYSTDSYIHVEAGSRLSVLLNQPELLYKLVTIPVPVMANLLRSLQFMKDCMRNNNMEIENEKNCGEYDDDNDDDDENEDEDDDDSGVYHVYINPAK